MSRPIASAAHLFCWSAAFRAGLDSAPAGQCRAELRSASGRVAAAESPPMLIAGDPSPSGRAPIAPTSNAARRRFRVGSRRRRFGVGRLAAAFFPHTIPKRWLAQSTTRRFSVLHGRWSCLPTNAVVRRDRENSRRGRPLTLQMLTDKRRRTKMFGPMPVTRMFQPSKLETVDEAVAKLWGF